MTNYIDVVLWGRSNEEQRSITSQPLVPSVIRARRMIWLEHVIQSGKDRNIFNINQTQLTDRKSLEKLWKRLIDNVKRDSYSQGIGQNEEAFPEVNVLQDLFGIK